MWAGFLPPPPPPMTLRCHAHKFITNRLIVRQTNRRETMEDTYIVRPEASAPCPSVVPSTGDVQAQHVPILANTPCTTERNTGHDPNLDGTATCYSVDTFATDGNCFQKTETYDVPVSPEKKDLELCIEEVIVMHDEDQELVLHGVIKRTWDTLMPSNTPTRHGPRTKGDPTSSERSQSPEAIRCEPSYETRASSLPSVGPNRHFTTMCHDPVNTSGGDMMQSPTKFVRPHAAFLQEWYNYFHNLHSYHCDLVTPHTANKQR